MGHSPGWWDRLPWTGSWLVLLEREEAGSRRGGDLVTAPERVGEALSGRRRWRHGLVFAVLVTPRGADGAWVWVCLMQILGIRASHPDWGA